MRIVRFFLYMILALGLSSLAVLYYVGNDAQFKQKVEQSLLASLSHDLACSLSGHLDSCNLITGNCTIKDAVASDATKQWKWSAQKVVISCFWFQLILKHILPMNVSCYNVEMFSKVQNKKLSIAEHFKRWALLPDSSIKTTVKSLNFYNIDGTITDETITTQSASFSLRMQGNGRVNVLKNGASLAFSIDNGSLWLAHELAFASLAGSLNMTVNDVVCGDFQLTGGCTFANIMKRCLISGIWKDDDLSAHLNSENRLFDVAMGMNANMMTFDGTAPCGDFLKIIHAPFKDHEGVCTFHVETPTTKPFDAYTGTITLNNWLYKTYNFPQYTGEFEFHDNIMHGKGQWEHSGIKGLSTYVWNRTKDSLSAELKLQDPITIKRLSAQCDHNKSYFNINVNLTDMIGHGSGKIVVNLPEKKSHTLNLTLTTERKKIELNCGLLENELNLFWFDDNEWYFAAGDYYRNGKYRGMIRQTPNGEFNGQCAMAAIAKIIGALTDSKIFGAGILNFNGNQQNSIISLHGSYDPGEFRIQNLYNGIQSAQFDCSYQIDKQMAMLHKLKARLNKGSIDIEHAVCTLAPDYSLDSYYIPMTLNDCFLHWKKEVSANATGYITLSYANNVSNIGGYIIMDKGQVQSNILAASPEQYITIGMIKPFASTGTQTNLAMSIKTSTPIKVSTSMLTAEALLNLSFKGTVSAPHIQGSVELTKGTLHFPYQPLYITEAKIYFLPNQFDKPIINLMAQNKIQKYLITMHVTGAVASPKISFDSSPSLTEQQITSLLLSGSDSGMLPIPLNISQTIESLLFGTPESSSKVQRSLGGFLDSIKNIRIIPRLSDKQGSVLIELNDNLRATIQKDLSNNEESRVEVEYGIGDDMVVRAVKDEHGEVGAEFEKSWKFS